MAHGKRDIDFDRSFKVMDSRCPIFARSFDEPTTMQSSNRIIHTLVDCCFERGERFVVVALLHQHTSELFMSFGLIWVDFNRPLEVSQSVIDFSLLTV